MQRAQSSLESSARARLQSQRCREARSSERKQQLIGASLGSSITFDAGESDQVARSAGCVSGISARVLLIATQETSIAAQ